MGVGAVTDAAGPGRVAEVGGVSGVEPDGVTVGVAGSSRARSTGLALASEPLFSAMA